MKHLFVCIFLLRSATGLSQQINCKVADASTGAPLPYATIIFKKTNQFLYADSSGEFSVFKDAALSKDSIIAEYLSYTPLTLPVNRLADGFIISLQPQLNQLQNVTVTACNSWETITVNKIPGKVKDYIGPGPEIRIIIITRFTNAENLTGFISEIECYSGYFTAKTQVPLRMHWYKWNSTANMPGEEITNTNIIVYPYQTGWNKFSVPPKTIYYSNDGVVRLNTKNNILLSQMISRSSIGSTI
jgi:hypothetical protein